ncbi:hypothetical protein [Cupriavidus sp. UME77]|uniref:hypothetical protein n=1 Tax=Cupriavidus sp. UME77 TaxID=1862321 RepID=UPI0016015A74|nr:hypothetical protein [Cupriavidus sp. UME77]MBB1634832.1 hypothetical protein [Cupriavidus sp. UME77]
MPEYAPKGAPDTQARLRIKAMDMYAYPAIILGTVEQDNEPKRQVLAVFTKGWAGIGKTPKESERIGMPASTDQDTNMPVLERYVSAGQPLSLMFAATLDGTLVCRAAAVMTPEAGHDYELVVLLQATSIGGNGRCGLLAYELQPGAGPDNRVPFMLRPRSVAER